LPVGETLVASLCLVCFWAIHCVGVRWFGRVQVVMCLLLVVSILVLVGPGLFAMSMQNYRPFFTGGAGGFLASLPTLFFAYAGFEALAHTAGEVRDSPKRLPRVYLRGVLWTTAIFLSMSAVSVGVLTAVEMSASTAPMAAAAAKFLPVGGALVVTVGAILALLTSVNATMAVPARLAITVAQDGGLPKGLARIDARAGTPVLGLTLSLGIALVVLWSGQDFALGIAVLALMGVYFLHSLAFLLLPRNNPDLAAEVALGLPVAVQRLAAWAALGALGILIVTLVIGDLTVIFFDKSFLERCGDKELTALELFVAWALLGWILHKNNGQTP
jgi:amino acid transporter